jgi:hypothetical protein
MEQSITFFIMTCVVKTTIDLLIFHFFNFPTFKFSNGCDCYAKGSGFYKRTAKAYSFVRR